MGRPKNLKYHHLGIPTQNPIDGEVYLKDYHVYHYGFERSEYGIEWMRYEEGCDLPEIVKNIPHVAFEVDDIQEAIRGKKVIIAPNSPSEGNIVAFIEENGAPVEFIQISKPRLETPAQHRGESILERTAAFVRSELENAEGGHDWFHIARVWNNAKIIAQTEPADLLTVELGALLHDLADHKFNNGDEAAGIGKARTFLSGQGVEESVIRHVENIMLNISFKGGRTVDFHSPEFDIVQDADRLDAIGAVGIARAFNYGGFRGRTMYDPADRPDLTFGLPGTAKGATTIHHFYEKLLLLKDRMNTATGRRMAEERHRFMEVYLEEFYRECGG